MLSEKQKESYRRATHRINIWEGAVRSGKSFISMLKFLESISRGPQGDIMIVGASRDSLQRNIISQICDWIHCALPTPKATGMHICGRRVHLVGASDERAQRRIQGSTVAIAYVDEITVLPEGFFRMLLTRLSVNGARLYGTCNPDSPYHWLKREFLDRSDEIDLISFPFRIEDNPSLLPETVNAIKSEHHGLYYQRYVEGKWVLADGLVYDHFKPEEHTLERCPGAEYYTVGIDYGTNNPTAFVLVGHNVEAHPNHWVEKEYYYDSNKEKSYKTDTDYAEALETFIRGYPVRAIYLDPTAMSFRSECKKVANFPPIIPADNQVIDGIRFVSKMIANGSLKINKRCLHLLREIASYSWDAKSSERGEDKPIKKFDHVLDALRYAIYTELFRSSGRKVNYSDLENAYNAARRKGLINVTRRPPSRSMGGWR